MIRFLEINGKYSDGTRAFGFYDTVNGKVIDFGGSYTFDDVEDFELFYTEKCGYPKERFMRLIPQWWYIYEKLSKGVCRRCGNKVEYPDGVTICMMCYKLEMYE